MLLDGEHLVTDALAAGVAIHEAAVAIDAIENAAIEALVRKLARASVDVVSVTAPVMAALSPVQSSSAIAALAARPGQHDDDPANVDGPIIVAVDIQDPGNLGAIVRVAEAGGAAAVLIAGTSADPFGWKALRGSMGSALRVPIAVHKGALNVGDLRARGFRVAAATPRGGRAPDEVDLCGRVAIVIGGEGPGLSPDFVRDADDRITIPMTPAVESLNMAVAAALLVYESRRQRQSARGAHL